MQTAVDASWPCIPQEAVDLGEIAGSAPWHVGCCGGRLTKDHHMSKPQELQTIDPSALAQVSAGAAQAPTTDINDSVLTALTGILDSLKSLSQQNQGGGINQQEMLMFMILMQQRNQQQAAAAAAASGGWWNQQPIVRYY
jgi:hypothetical protein